MSNFLAPTNRPNILKKWRFWAILAILGPTLAPFCSFFSPRLFFQISLILLFLGFLCHLSFDKKILSEKFFVKFFAHSNRPKTAKKWRFWAILAILGPILPPIGRFLWENQPNQPETFLLGLLWHLFDKKINDFFFEFFSPLKSANYSEKMAIFGHFGHFGAHFGTNWPISLGKSAKSA